MFSRFFRVPAASSTQRAFYSTTVKQTHSQNANLRPLHKRKKIIPQPSETIPDVETFLNKIGRNTIELKEHFPDWKKLFSMESREMKEAGIEVQARRYILHQLQKYRDGKKIEEIRKGKKSYFGGEYRRRHNKAVMHAAARRERYAKLEASDQANPNYR